MAVMREMNRGTEPPSGDRKSRHRRKRRRKRKFGIPAILVFYATATLSVMSFGLVYLRGERFLVFSVVACLLLLAVLVINEQTGFYRSRRMRRASEARDKFTMFEVAVLFALLLLGIFVSIFVWVI